MPSELRPDHADRPVRFEYQNEERDDLREMFAVHTHEEVQAVIDRIEAKDRGKPLGEQMLADAHRRGDESDRPNIAINLRSDLTAQPRLAAGLVQHYNCIQATSQERQAMATAEQISDPILGEGAIDKSATLACFKKHFGPTEQTVLVLTSVNNGMVPKAQRALYQELED